MSTVLPCKPFAFPGIQTSSLDFPLHHQDNKGWITSPLPASPKQWIAIPCPSLLGDLPWLILRLKWVHYTPFPWTAFSQDKAFKSPCSTSREQRV